MDKLLNRYFKMVDRRFEDFNEEDVDLMYAGASMNARERVKQHITNGLFTVDGEQHFPDKTWSRKNLFNITVGESPQDKELVANIEQYIIEKTIKMYGNKCLNSRNNDGSITQSGGRGLVYEGESNKIYFYILFKRS